jgi:hypothetical protein
MGRGNLPHATRQSAARGAVTGLLGVLDPSIF